jgi:hypothetical protein
MAKDVFPFVSIIVVNYNCRDRLREYLDFLRQSYTNFEVILLKPILVKHYQIENLHFNNA